MRIFLATQPGEPIGTTPNGVPILGNDDGIETMLEITCTISEVRVDLEDPT